MNCKDMTKQLSILLTQTLIKNWKKTAAFCTVFS